MYTKIKSAEEIENMRKAGDICSRVLSMLKASVKPGMNTKQLAGLAAKQINSSGAKAAFLGYKGFPDVVCISVNEEVVHGIPRKDKIIKPGDIISFDLGIEYKGMIVDSAVSVLVDSSDKSKVKLLNTTEEALKSGLKELKNRCKVGDIGCAIEKVLEKRGFGIVRELVGHGVGHDVHEDPNIPNYGKAKSGPELYAGMTVAIEPMATLGSEKVYIDSDNWTVKTQDHSLAAHFEQTVLITSNGYEALTPFR